VKTEEFQFSQSHDRGWLQDLNYTIEDRATCETDPTLQQVIPYIVLVDRKTNRVLTYRRGQGGGENRLHGLYSIGFGGHIEMGALTLMQAVYQTASKEVMVQATVDLADQLKDHLVETETSTLRFPPYRLLYAKLLELDGHRVCEADTVHVGVVCVLEVNANDFKTFEEGTILHAEWRSMPWLQSVAEDDSSNAKLESWSKYIINTGMLRALRNQNSLQKLAKVA
jgi:predicted NUDIX family phosphoesterase